MVTYFGKPYYAPIYLESHQIPTPVGASCIYCEEAILEGEDGFQDDGGSVHHRECFLRMIFGSVAHQSKTCSCYKSDPTDRGCDEEGLTKRERAKAALAYRESVR